MNAMPTATNGSVSDSAARPIHGASVSLGDGSQTTTDASGKFAFPLQVKPYDVTVVSADGASATLFQGLTRPDPTLTFLAVGSGTFHQTFVSGDVSGGSAGTGAMMTTVAFGAADSNQQFAQSTGASYAAIAAWRSAATTDSFSIHAIQSDSSGEVIQSFTGYGSSHTPLSDGQSASGVDVAFFRANNVGGSQWKCCGGEWIHVSHKCGLV